MKTFAEMSQILHEAKFKIASGEKELSKETAKIGGKKVNIVYVQNKRNKVDVYMDGNKFSGDMPYKDLKSAQKEMKSIKKVMSQMSEEGISIGEIIDEINI
jgi:hypothetical protein|tara:strand:- start:40 stop:342 length:303 start_codon:yes stop_codon:yes gene_type:complete